MSGSGEGARRAPEGLTINGYDHGQMERACSAKNTYPTRAIAKRWAKVRGLSVYRCGVCGSYHLTSQRKGRKGG